MLNEKYFIQREQDYLRQTMPHHVWHYLLTFAALAVAATSFWYPFGSWDAALLQAVAIPVLSSYWWLQFRILRSASQLVHRPNETYENAIYIKARAVMRHHRFFILLVSISLLGLSLAIAGFLLFGAYNAHQYTNTPFSRGILQYVGVVGTGYVPWRLDYPFLPYQRLFFITIMGVAIVPLTFSNSFLTASIGVWAGRLQRAFNARLILMGVVFSVFLGLYFLRMLPPWACFHSQMIMPNNCDDVLFQMRLIDSFQAIFLTFVDGGAALATGLHGCGGSTFFEISSYQGRHLIAIIVVLVYQQALSNFFLSHSRPKENLETTLPEIS